MKQLTFAQPRPRQGMFTDSTGHRHWGYYGAAGLMVRYKDPDGTVWYLLQQRSQHVHSPGTWSVPGGALEKGETPEEAAWAEFEEEMGPLPQGIEHVETRKKTYGTGEGAWNYWTVVVDAPRMFRPQPRHAQDWWEVAGSGWFTVEDMKGLSLHPGFYESTEFPDLKKPRPPKVPRATQGRRVRGHWFKPGELCIVLDLGNDRYARVQPGKKPEAVQCGAEESAKRMRQAGWQFRARKSPELPYTGPVGPEA